MRNEVIYMEKQTLDFYNTLTLEGKAKKIVNMPNGSVVTLIADSTNFDYLCNDLSVKDKELLNKCYVPRCESFINLRNDKTRIAKSMDWILSDISLSVFNEMHIGRFALSDKDFAEDNKRLRLCDEDKVRSGETLLYIFDLAMFSNRECWGVQKAYVTIDSIGNGEFNIKISGTNAGVFHSRCYDYEYADAFVNDIETVFKELLEKALMSIADNIVYRDLYV